MPSIIFCLLNRRNRRLEKKFHLALTAKLAEDRSRAHLQKQFLTTFSSLPVDLLARLRQEMPHLIEKMQQDLDHHP